MSTQIQTKKIDEEGKKSSQTRFGQMIFKESIGYYIFEFNTNTQKYYNFKSLIVIL